MNKIPQPTKLEQLERRFEMMLAASRDSHLLEAWADLKIEVMKIVNDALEQMEKSKAQSK